MYVFELHFLPRNFNSISVCKDPVFYLVFLLLRGFLPFTFSHLSFFIYFIPSAYVFSHAFGFLIFKLSFVQKYLKYQLIFPKSNAFYINAYCSLLSYSSAIFCPKDCDSFEFGITWSVVQEQVLIIVSGQIPIREFAPFWLSHSAENYLAVD